MLSTDFSLPTFYERAKALTVRMPLYEDGQSPVIPVSGTFTLYNASKVAVTTGSVTVGTNGIASFDVIAIVLPDTTPLSDKWLEEWVLTLQDGRVETIRRDAYVCLRMLYNVVSEVMLLRRVSDLNDLKPPNKSNFHGYIDEAWNDTNVAIIQQGKRPYLIMNSYALKNIVFNRTLQYIFEDLETYMGEGRYSKRATEYAKLADDAFDDLKMEYDTSESNSRLSSEASLPVISVIYTNTPPLARRRTSYGGF